MKPMKLNANEVTLNFEQHNHRGSYTAMVLLTLPLPPDLVESELSRVHRELNDSLWRKGLQFESRVLWATKELNVSFSVTARRKKEAPTTESLKAKLRQEYRLVEPLEDSLARMVVARVESASLGYWKEREAEQVAREANQLIGHVVAEALTAAKEEINFAAKMQALRDELSASAARLVLKDLEEEDARGWVYQGGEKIKPDVVRLVKEKAVDHARKRAQRTGKGSAFFDSPPVSEADVLN